MTLGKLIELSTRQIELIDSVGGDLESMLEYGRYTEATKKRIVRYMNRPVTMAPNGGWFA